MFDQKVMYCIDNSEALHSTKDTHSYFQCVGKYIYTGVWKKGVFPNTARLKRSVFYFTPFICFTNQPKY